MYGYVPLLTQLFKLILILSDLTTVIASSAVPRLKVKLEYSNHRFREEEKKQFISETDAGADPMHALRAELLPTRRPSRLMSDSFAGKNMILRGQKSARDGSIERNRTPITGSP